MRRAETCHAYVVFPLLEVFLLDGVGDRESIVLVQVDHEVADEAIPQHVGDVFLLTAEQDGLFRAFVRLDLAEQAKRQRNALLRRILLLNRRRVRSEHVLDQTALRRLLNNICIPPQLVIAASGQQTRTEVVNFHAPHALPFDVVP